MLNSDDKVILYNIIEREVDNFLVGVPVLSAFSTVISNYVIKYIEPYVNAFMSHGHIDVDQLSEFTKSEINEKVKNFKRKYEEERQSYENETNF